MIDAMIYGAWAIFFGAFASMGAYEGWVRPGPMFGKVALIVLLTFAWGIATGFVAWVRSGW